MAKTTATCPGGALGQHLEMERFHGLAASLAEWRTNAELTKLEVQKGSGLVLGFVKGLRLSAQLVYILRGRLASTGLEVDWGHLLGPEGNPCSPECDVIIHNSGYHEQWNGPRGVGHPVMDFKFIKCTETVAVVSCKSMAENIDTEYAKKLKPYIKKILLFAECCSASKVNMTALLSIANIRSFFMGSFS